MAVLDRFDIVRERLPPDLGEVVAGAMARAGYRLTREAADAAGPYRGPAGGPLSASFEPDPAARPRRIGQVQVRQEDDRTLRVEIAFPPVWAQWQWVASIAWMLCWFPAMLLVLPWLHLPHWAEMCALMFPTILGTQWFWHRSAATPPSQAYRLILDAMADALDDAKRVRIESGVPEAAPLSDAGDQAEADGGEDGAALEERRRG